MKFVIVFLACATFTAANLKVGFRIQPRDIADQVAKEIETLKDLTRESIDEEKYNVATKITELDVYQIDMQDLADIRLQEEYGKFKATIDTLKQLAIGYDIEVCLKDTEPALDALPAATLKKMNDCGLSAVGGVQSQTSTIMDELVIDVVNIVAGLEDQLESCNTVTCITQVGKDVATNQMLLPQKIKLETNKALQLIDIAHLLVDQCYDNNIADMVSQGNRIVNDIAACVNEVLG